MPHRELGKDCMAETQPTLGKQAGQDWVVSDITTAPQYSELGGAGKRCPHFADEETKVHRGQVTSEHIARKRQSQDYAFCLLWK